MSDNKENKSILSNDLTELLENLPNEEVNDDTAWLDDMYSDTQEFKDYMKSLNHEKKNNIAVKIVGKNFIELTDAKNNPIKVPSEKYISSLEEKVTRLEEVMRVQNNQISFLNSKLVEINGQLKILYDIIGHFSNDI
jgi:hypothetical protein